MRSARSTSARSPPPASNGSRSSKAPERRSTATARVPASSTSSPRATAPRTRRRSSRSAAGSFDTSRFALETGTFSFSHEYAANTYPYSTAPNTATSATRANADLNSFNARFTDYGTFGNFSISGSAGFVSRVLGVPGQLGSLTLFARQQDDTQDARVTLALHHPQAVTTLDLSGTRETLTFGNPSPNEFGPFLDFSSDGRVEANLRNNVTSAANRLIYGADLAHGVARNDGGGGVYSATSYAQTALYAQDSMVFGGNSRLYAGVRGEQDGAAGGAISPSLGGTLGLGGAFALKVNFGTAFRVPTAVDLTFPGFSNPFLQPERTQSFDATIAGARLLGGGASFGWFVQTATNLITLNPNADFSMPFGPGNEPLVNQQQSSVAGFVLDLATRPFYGIVAQSERYRHVSRARVQHRDAGAAAGRPARLHDEPRPRLRRRGNERARGCGCDRAYGGDHRPRRRGRLHGDRRATCVSGSRSTCCFRSASTISATRCTKNSRAIRRRAARSSWNSRHADAPDGDRAPRTARGTVRARRRRNGDLAARSARRARRTRTQPRTRRRSCGRCACRASSSPPPSARRSRSPGR